MAIYYCRWWLCTRRKRLEKAKAMMDERAFKTEFLASFETTGNRAAYNFDSNIHVKEAKQLTRQPILGIRFQCGLYEFCS